MKKSKLFISLTGVSVLGAATPIIATSTSCGCNPSVTLSEIKAEDTVAKRICGVSIKKSEIKVTATYSNNSTKEITDWTCDDFNNEGVYTPSDIKTFNHTFTIKYSENSIEKTTSIKINFSADGVTGFALDEYTLGMPKINQVEWQTSQKLVVFWETGEMVDPSLLTFTSSNTEYAEIDKEGVLTAKKDTTYYGSLTITAKWKDSSHGSQDITTTVSIKTFEDNNVTFDDDHLTATIKIADVWCPVGPSLIIPRAITKSSSNSSYKVVGISEQSTQITRAKYLSLPNTLNSICAEAFDSCNIIKMFYNGTISQFKEISCGKDWYGQATLGIQCTDGFLTFDNCYEAQVCPASAYTSGSYLDPGVSFGKTTGTNFTVKFDYSKLALTDEQAKATNILGWKEKESESGLESHELKINKIYIDDVLASERNDYEYTNNKVIWQTNCKLNKNSIVTVNFSLNQASSKDVYIAAAQLK